MATEKPIGKVVHYFPHVEVAVVKLNTTLKKGDKIKLKRGDDEFEQTVKSMQIDHKDIKVAKKGKEIGLKVDKKVKEGWEVYKA
jgi:putative protease